MTKKNALRIFTFFAVLAGLSGCVLAPSSRQDTLEPLALTAENFYEQVAADLMAAAQANQLVALAECGDTGRFQVAGESTQSSAQALTTLLSQLRVALLRSGSNTYVLESVEWQPIAQNPAGIRLVLQLRGLICSA